MSSTGDLPPPPPASTRSGSDEAIRTYLREHGWPTGLQNTLIGALISTPARFFICDDSGSMMSSDGNMIIKSGNKTKVIECTRWSELAQTLKFHVNTAHIACAPTEFRMLNGASPIMIGSSDSGDELGIPIITSILDGSPGGVTPLCYHVNQVAQQITAIAPELRAAGKKAALIILSDGEASDGDITTALKPLTNLPVWVVIRLCTSEEPVVSYWSNIDSQLELNMDVLDDPLGESREVAKVNTWLTYGVPLHRLREFGVTTRELDILDEAKLSAENMRNICAFIFGVRAQDLPHPEVDWTAFHDRISELNDKEPMIWSPVTKVPAKWINMKQLTATFAPAKTKGKDSSKGVDLATSKGVDLGDSCCIIA